LMFRVEEDSVNLLTTWAFIPEKSSHKILPDMNVRNKE
jgi:hypothetical protein